MNYNKISEIKKMKTKRIKLIRINKIYKTQIWLLKFSKLKIHLKTNFSNKDNFNKNIQMIKIKIIKIKSKIPNKKQKNIKILNRKKVRILIIIYNKIKKKRTKI